MATLTRGGLGKLPPQSRPGHDLVHVMPDPRERSESIDAVLNPRAGANLTAYCVLRTPYSLPAAPATASYPRQTFSSAAAVPAAATNLGSLLQVDCCLVLVLLMYCCSIQFNSIQLNSSQVNRLESLPWPVPDVVVVLLLQSTNASINRHPIDATHPFSSSFT